jgi:RNA polymerase sigma factor (sigma-70 family)
MLIILFILVLITDAYVNPNKLIVDNYKLVHHILNKDFNYLPIDAREEVKQQAFYGFVKSAHNYYPHKNTKFSTYASYYIKGYAFNAIRKHKKYKERFSSNNFEDKYYLDSKNTYKTIYKSDIESKFYKECKDKDILYDYFHYKIDKQDIADKYNMTKKQVTYKIKVNLFEFKRHNNI